jgi:hypothetical protein
MIKFSVLLILFLNLSCFSLAGRYYHAQTEEWNNDISSSPYSAIGCLVDLVMAVGLIQPNPTYAAGYFAGTFIICSAHRAPYTIKTPVYTENDSDKKKRTLLNKEDKFVVIRKSKDKYFYNTYENYLGYIKGFANLTPSKVTESFSSKEIILDDFSKRYPYTVSIVLTLENIQIKGQNLTKAILENKMTGIKQEFIVDMKNSQGIELRADHFERKILLNIFPRVISVGPSPRWIAYNSELMGKDKRFKEVCRSFEIFLYYYENRKQEIKDKKYIYFEKFYNDLIKLDQALGENKKEYLPEIYYLYGMYHLFNGETIIAKEYFLKITKLEIKNNFDWKYVQEVIKEIEESQANSNLDNEYE